MNDRKIGMFQAMKLCSKYQKMTEAEQDRLRQKRLHQMVAWARNNSPYYASLYQNVAPTFQLSDLPPVNKVDLMAHWDDWVTDRDISLSEVETFMENLDHIGRKLNQKYLVFTTSGSTGNPLVALCDSTTNHVMGAINAARSFSYRSDMIDFIKRGGKSIGVFATGGFYLGNSSVRSRLLMMPWKKKQMAVTSALLPTAQIVAELNAFQPAMLGGYPSNLELLLEEQQSGRLQISPVLIMTGGEYLSDSLRARLTEAFHCHVQTSYSCTEGGTIACECKEQHFHINDDWIILEPVDNNNRPVPFGVQADKILLTNLFNFTQPFIRYEITDRVIVHKEACACGNPSPWLTLEGRTDDVVTFTSGEHSIKIPPLAIYATLKEVHELRRFQFVTHPSNRAELRLEPADGIRKEDAFIKAKSALDAFLLTHGVQIMLTCSEKSPRQDSGSGKFKHIIQE